MTPHIIAQTTKIVISPLMQDVFFLILGIIIMCIILWVYHVTTIPNQETLKGLRETLKSQRKMILDLEKKIEALK